LLSSNITDVNIGTGAVSAFRAYAFTPTFFSRCSIFYFLCSLL